MNVPFHQDSASGGAFNCEQHIGYLDGPVISFIANSGLRKHRLVVLGYHVRLHTES